MQTVSLNLEKVELTDTIADANFHIEDAKRDILYYRVKIRMAKYRLKVIQRRLSESCK